MRYLKRNLNIFFCFVVLILVTVPGNAQVAKVQNKPGYDYKWIHFGFMVGANTMDFGFERSAPNSPGSDSLFADISSPRPGFQVSIVSDLRLGDRFSLRFLPGITFGSRQFSFYKLDGNEYEINTFNVESNYLDFPLLFKYKSMRVNNYRPYLVGGMAFRFDMARKPYDPLLQPVILKRGNFYFELGFGIDFFLQYFKFAPEIKLSVGIMDQMNHENTDRYNFAIERLNSYLVMLCFYFE